MTDTDPQIPTLAKFIELIEARVPMRSQDALAESVHTLASYVPAEQRMEALHRMPERSAATDPEFTIRQYPEIPPSAPGGELVDEVDGFVRRLEDGEFYQGYGWDDERNEERAWGDDSWAKEMDELFGRAATAYLNGNQQLAARVYGRLLHTFRHRDRVGVFCGPEPAERMVQTNLSEAKRRYFRAQYEISAVSDRPTRLLAEMEALRTVGEVEVGLRVMMDTEPDGAPPLEGTDTFLPSWITVLKGVRHDPKGWGREARRLLREAVELRGGVDGLGRLARDMGADHPEAYHEWVGMLVRLDRVPEAIRAAREGVDRIRDAVYRARLADRLAFLATAEEDHTLSVEATRSAWRASPTEVRLLSLVTAAERAGVRDTLLVGEAATVLRADWNNGDALACRLLLLVGRHEEAVTRFQRADALGWGRADHAGSVVLPFLLLASTDQETPPESSAIAALWEDLDAPGRQYFDRRLLLDAMTAGAEASADAMESERPYSALLAEAVLGHPIPEIYRPRMLAAAQIKVEAVVREIINGQHRRGHNLAAKLTIAVAEAIALSQTVDDGIRFARRIRKDYRRYSVFKDALDDARRGSPVLPDPSPRPERPSLVVVK